MLSKNKTAPRGLSTNVGLFIIPPQEKFVCVGPIIEERNICKRNSVCFVSFCVVLDIYDWPHGRKPRPQF